MSLIHEALKKAEAEKTRPGGGESFPQNRIVTETVSSSRRVVILSIGVALSLAFLVYMRFMRGPKTTAAAPQTAPLIQPAEIMQKPPAIKTKALELARQSEWKKSLLLWRELTMLTPTDAEIYNNLGISLKKTGKKKEAYEAYLQALALNKDYPEALNNLGVLYFNDGLKTKAKDHFQRAIALKPGYPDPHFHLALILENEGAFQQAQEEYRFYLNNALGISEDLKQKLEFKIKRLERR